MGTLNTTDFNSVLQSGFYKSYFSNESDAEKYNCPISGVVCLIVSNQRNLIMQFVYGSNGAASRSGTLVGNIANFSGWYKMARAW